MTERWRKKLESLDGASPSDDVFERAKLGPMHRDEALPGPRMSARVVTVIAAFLVFALAISVFAIPALRMNNSPAGGASQGLMPLWPSQSSDQLQKLQTGADAGEANWALDPKALTQKFAQEVLGWSGPVVMGNPGTSCYVYPPASGGPSPISCNDVPVGGYSAPAGVPADVFSTPPSLGVDGPFKTYAVLQCAECPTREWVQVYQPLEQGEGGIWAVLQVQGTEGLSVAPGQVVHNGATVSAGFSTYSRFIPTLGYGSCGQSAASSAFHAPAGSDNAGIQSDVQLTGGCDGEQPGYVWAATALQTLADTGGGVADPFNGGHSELMSLTAVPVTMVFGAAETTSTSTPTRVPTTSISPASTTWTKYTDPYGWTIDVPPGWETNVITVGGGGTQGAQFVGDNMSIQVSTQTAPSGSPPPALGLPAANDSQFPLTTDGVLSNVEGGLGGHFVGNGLQFDVLVLSPSLPDPLPQADADVLDRMIGSISFQPWSVGDVRHDWVAIPTPTQAVSWITVEGGLYILFKTSDGYKIYGSISCGGKKPSKTSSRADGFAVLECPDGSTWEMNATGESGGGGDAAGNDPPPEWAVATAQDGTLIAWVLPGVFPPGTGGSSPAPG